MGRKKQGNGRDSNSKKLGTKVYGGQKVKPGYIIVRQKGTKIVPGDAASMGKDFTIYSLAEGILEFTERRGKKVANVISTAPSQ